jgi:hypothetical protein
VRAGEKSVDGDSQSRSSSTSSSTKQRSAGVARMAR